MRCPQRHPVVQFESTETQKPSTQNENIFVNYISRFCGDVKKPTMRQPLLPVFGQNCIVRISGRDECACDERHRKRANPPDRLASLKYRCPSGAGPWSFSGRPSRLYITHGKGTVMCKRMDGSIIVTSVLKTEIISKARMCWLLKSKTLLLCLNSSSHWEKKRLKTTADYTLPRECPSFSLASDLSSSSQKPETLRGSN